MFEKVESPGCFCLYKKLDHKLAQVEVNQIKENEWLIARILVPATYRNQGIATGLMQELISWADEKEVTLVAGINHYKDVNKEKLIEFFKKHGFKEEIQENDIFFKRALN